MANQAPPAKVTVYAPDGHTEEHTRANARDLVNGAGYSWIKQAPSTPVDSAPYAVSPTKVYKKTAAQEVLDGHGKKTVEDAEEADDDEEAEVEATPEPEAAVQAVAEAPADDNSGSRNRSRRGRSGS